MNKLFFQSPLSTCGSKHTCQEKLFNKYWGLCNFIHQWLPFLSQRGSVDGMTGFTEWDPVSHPDLSVGWVSHSVQMLSLSQFGDEVQGRYRINIPEGK